jgi:predicted Holliday junction resolvase-like endonuclease
MGWALKALTVSIAVRAVSMEDKALEEWERSWAMRGEAKDWEKDWMRMVMRVREYERRKASKSEAMVAVRCWMVKRSETRREGQRSADVVREHMSPYFPSKILPLLLCLMWCDRFLSILV